MFISSTTSISQREREWSRCNKAIAERVSADLSIKINKWCLYLWNHNVYGIKIFRKV